MEKLWKFICVDHYQVNIWPCDVMLINRYVIVCEPSYRYRSGTALEPVCQIIFFEALAQSLREGVHDLPEMTNSFNRLLFCIFAEDIDLLADHELTYMPARSTRFPRRA